jgi:hypothetical protein
MHQSASTPPALVSALTSYEKTYQVSYAKALEKFDGKVWYEPTEAERKAVVAGKRKGRDIAYAPTGTSLEAGKLLSQSEFQEMMEKRMASQNKPANTVLASASPVTFRPGSAADRMKQDRLPTAGPIAQGSAAQGSVAQGNGAQSTGTIPTIATAQGTTTTVPIPAQNPLAYAAPPITEEKKKPFWKFWSQE